MKAVMLSIQPYYVFLIIAHLMGWDIPHKKTVEVRKDFPKDPAWDKVVHIYCSKNRKSFDRIPKQFQPLMEKLLGKVIGEFVCDKCFIITRPSDVELQNATCLTESEMLVYGNDKDIYGWHISDLKIYDKAKELSEFRRPCECEHDKEYASYHGICDRCLKIARPPQSWCYVEENINE